jgi:hypothetical protein
MQVARISTYSYGSVRIPRIFQEAFHLFGGEEVTLFPQGKNCLLIFMVPVYTPMAHTKLLRRFKATVSDNVGASSALYKAIEDNRGVRILSAQGTTTGRGSRAVGDLLLDVPRHFDDVEFILNVLQGSPDCAIGDLREHKPVESSAIDLRALSWAHIRSHGRDLPVPPEVLRNLGQEPNENLNDAKVIINWDTETTVLALTFVRPSDKIGTLILFLRGGDDHVHTGEVGEVLRVLGVDFLWLQINHLGDAGEILCLLDHGHVKRWIIVADFSKASPAMVIAESLQRHSNLFYGGLIKVQSDEAVLFGGPKEARFHHFNEVRKSAESLCQSVNRLWSAEDEI